MPHLLLYNLKVTLEGLRLNVLCLILVGLVSTACTKPEAAGVMPAIVDGLPLPSSVEVAAPSYFGAYNIPSDNPQTDAGVRLGRMLFYEPMLSADNSVSCSSCHKQDNAFTDGNAFSKGIYGRLGKRSSMSLVNLLFDNKFFWDGRAASIEAQVHFPVSDTLEMASSIDLASTKLQATSVYPGLFNAAFGSSTITGANLVKAIAQFERTIISAQSNYDKYLMGTYTPSDAERRGIALFFTHPDGISVRGGNCGDCHNPVTLNGIGTGTRGIRNNGISSSFPAGADIGLEALTNDAADKGKFKIPTLRNIALSAPYMHDGRFSNLNDVVDHYNAPNLSSQPNVDTLIRQARNNRFTPGLGLSAQEKQDIVAFLNMLTDNNLITNPAFGNPHKK